MKQLIIARKDLPMSPGKLAAQVSHASMAFLTWPLRNSTSRKPVVDENGDILFYQTVLTLDKNIWDDWINGSFTKVICEAKNKNHLMKVVAIAQSLGLTEGIDYFLIKDNCYTELQPEEIDEDGVGRTLTCIGFKPLPDEMEEKIGKKYQLYRGYQLYG